MKLEVYTKRVCGQLRYYPTCKASIVLTQIKKMPTLTQGDIDSLRSAGFEVIVYGEGGG